MMFGRRLHSNESNLFLGILQNYTERGSCSNQLAESYLRHPDTVMFTSDLEGRTIGATCVRKDKNRLGMVLSAVAVQPDEREASAYNLVKSSLPFFRTVAIRDVDAILSESRSSALGFPLNLALDSWIKSVLSRLGFDQVGTIVQIEGAVSQDGTDEYQRSWDREANHEEARSLLWDFGRSVGLETSLAWAAFDLAASLGRLETISVRGKTAMLAGLFSLGDSVIVTPLLCNPELVMPEHAVDILANRLKREQASRVLLPLLGSGQEALIRAADRSFSARAYRLSLMRKRI
jgi:hypothetical protein